MSIAAKEIPEAIVKQPAVVAELHSEYERFPDGANIVTQKWPGGRNRVITRVCVNGLNVQVRFTVNPDQSIGTGEVLVFEDAK